MTALLAIDWGTSSLRGALLDAGGRVRGERGSPQGILAVPPGGFGAVFDDMFGDWARQAGRTLICGMAGSRQGWREAPYCPCPAGLDDLAATLAPLDRPQTWLVPGLVCDTAGRPDVMRGEETQVFGALDLLALDDATLVLPGTHSKWVTVRAGRVTGFRTAMTGEMYGLLRQQSILARMLPAGADVLDGAALRRGVEVALREADLLHTLFSVRTLALFERMAPEALPSYLSGLLIGEELRAQGALAAHTVIVGAPALAERYALALDVLGRPAQTLSSEATWRGLWRIGERRENA